MQLPNELKDKIDMSEVARPQMGYSDAEVYEVKHGYLNKDIVIKCSASSDIEKEAQILIWLQDKIKVPQVYFHLFDHGIYYLVMEMLPGMMGQYGFKQMSREEMVILYANEIKKWHQIDYHDFPSYNTLEDKLKHVRHNIKHSLVKTQYFEREFQGMSGQDVYDLMMAHYPKDFDLVLCHGDVCMPNFMIEDKKITGWIDVVGCGVNDRYLDIAIALRTLRFNFEWLHETFTPSDMHLFLQTYGIEILDMDKVLFYICLDELTNG